MKYSIKDFILLFWVCLLLVRCSKDEYLTDSNVTLSFSKDTLQFDTIFTSIGSATKYFKVYNKYDKKVILSQVSLGKGLQSCYRLNVNGIPGNSVKDVEIPSKDSIFIFVDVTINPIRNQLIEQDSVIFTINGNRQDVKLIAFGQDVHLIDGKIIKTTTWTNDKPYLVYNSMLIDTLETLSILEGTKLYFHKKSRLYVKGTINVKGSFEKPVIFQGDRPEKLYEDIPGQWNGIWLINGSKHNRFEYAVIKNAYIGIQADTLADRNVPTLTILNSKIEHHTIAGIYAQASSINAANCVISDCGIYAVALTLGGSYEFYHCTIANYWYPLYSNRTTPSVFINNFYEYNNHYFIKDLTKAYFGNCIIYGDKDNEIGLDKFPGTGKFDYSFENCLIKIDESVTPVASNFKTCQINKNPKFKEPYHYNFQLDTLSGAKDKGDISIVNRFIHVLRLDINKKDRTIDNAPDIGAYERVEK